MSSKKPLQNKPQPKPASPNLIHLRSVTSTNDYARVLAESGASHGTAVKADTQTKGRGRTGSKWISPIGGLWMSIILRPESQAKRLSLTPLLASLAVAVTLEKSGVKGWIKWPNDVVANGRKIAGILCESRVSGEKYQWVIVGIGINVNNSPPTPPADNSRYRATSIRQEKGTETNLPALAVSIRDSVMEHYDSVLKDNKRAMLDEYNDRHILRNRKVRVSLTDQILEGVAGEVDIEGRLSVQDSDGANHKLRSEEVLLVEIS